MSKCLEGTNTNSIEQLRNKRRNWVEASRDNNFEGGIKQLLTDLYPDNAHFIYELLQNAEDPHATVVRFTLSDSNVEFEHNGEKLFSLEDICSITSIGASNKPDDPTSIGKFGVGFKAVFAYTNTPEIHSGDLHFRIHDLVVPETEGVHAQQMNAKETRFTFPFNNPKKPTKQAVDEIERGLRSLGDNTLLFLSHIRKIEYLLPDGTLGSLERISLPNNRIDILARQPGMEETISHWLRFEKNVEVVDEDGKSKDCRIAIAYQLAKEEAKKEGGEWKIAPLDHGQVSIYFPAEKETSKLRFHIHAPFASTVARDSVRDCDANKALRNHIAALVAEKLTSIKEQGLLTVGFLAVLPNPDDKLSSFYEPIRQAIVETFKQHPVVPLKAGGHEAANALVRCPAKLATALSEENLFLIAGKSLRVAANPPQLNQREDQFLKSLGISDWGWKELNIAISSTEQRTQIEGWLKQQDNKSLAAIYELLNHSREQVKEWDRLSSRYITHMNIANVRIVRAGSVSNPIMCTPKEAFFPQVDIVAPNDIHVVHPDFCSGESRALLESIGVHSYDEKANIGRILEGYKSLDKPGADHVEHIKRFIAFLKKNPSDKDLFAKVGVLLGKKSNGDLEFVTPSKLYLDTPYLETLLNNYYDRLLDDKRISYPLATTYEENGVNIEELASFAKAIGVRSSLNVQQLDTIWDNPDKSNLTLGGVEKRNNDSYRRFQRDFDVPEFNALLARPTIESTRLVWKTMSESVKPEHLLATYRRNNHSDEKCAPSKFVHHLRVANWVPQGNGRFVKPSEARISELPAGFPYDPGKDWLKAIGFGEDEKRHSEEYQARDRIAQDMGLSSADELASYIDAIKESGLTSEQIRALGLQKKQVSQPEEAVKDPEKRRRGVREGKGAAPPNESVTRERSIQPGIPEVTAEAKAYLRTKYKNSEDQLVCQCCHEDMPFRLPSGDHYFEAVQYVRNQDAHYHQNRLALCPTCAAMYQYARETDDAELRRRIVDHTAADQAPSVEIPIRLAGRDHTLYFVGTHWFDLKTVLGGEEAI